MNRPLVNHTTKVSINLSAFIMADTEVQPNFSPSHVRALGIDINNRQQKLADALEQLITIGFSVKWERGIISAHSYETSASEVKKLLIKHGLKDREFKVYLEYERCWGMM